MTVVAAGLLAYESRLRELGDLTAVNHLFEKTTKINLVGAARLWEK